MMVTGIKVLNQEPTYSEKRRWAPGKLSNSKQSPPRQTMLGTSHFLMQHGGSFNLGLKRT